MKKDLNEKYLLDLKEMEQKLVEQKAEVETAKNRYDSDKIHFYKYKGTSQERVNESKKKYKEEKSLLKRMTKIYKKHKRKGVSLYENDDVDLVPPSI